MLFSKREQQVTDLLVLGMRQVDIAKQLGISPKTVACHKQRICEKLGIATRDFINVAITNPSKLYDLHAV